MLSTSDTDPLTLSSLLRRSSLFFSFLLLVDASIQAVPRKSPSIDPSLVQRPAHPLSSLVSQAPVISSLPPLPPDGLPPVRGTFSAHLGSLCSLRTLLSSARLTHRISSPYFFLLHHRLETPSIPHHAHYCQPLTDAVLGLVAHLLLPSFFFSSRRLVATSLAISPSSRTKAWTCAQIKKPCLRRSSHLAPSWPPRYVHHDALLPASSPFLDNPLAALPLCRVPFARQKTSICLTLPRDATLFDLCLDNLRLGNCPSILRPIPHTRCYLAFAPALAARINILSYPILASPAIPPKPCHYNQFAYYYTHAPLSSSFSLVHFSQPQSTALTYIASARC